MVLISWILPPVMPSASCQTSTVACGLPFVARANMCARARACASEPLRLERVAACLKQSLLYLFIRVSRATPAVLLDAGPQDHGVLIVPTVTSVYDEGERDSAKGGRAN